MNHKGINSTTLKAALKSIFSGEQSYEKLKYLINFCHKIALSYIWLKTGKTKFRADKFGLSANDLAFDSIADLFKNDDPYKTYPELYNYFVEHHTYESLDETDVLILLRKLVFSSVNHRIFRLYQSNDPALGKLIRNIKLSIKDHPGIELTRLMNKEYIKPKFLPSGINTVQDIGGDELAVSFTPKNNITLREIINQVADTLLNSGKDVRKISLTEAALSIRTLFYQELFPECYSTVSPLLRDEILMFIKDAIGFLENTIIKKYRISAKLHESVAEIFIKAIRELLIDEFVELNGHEKSYYEYLSFYIPGLSEEEYGVKYRTKFEYCAKITKENLRTLLKNEL
ncbi:MAG: hypothetical protein HUU54_10365 [Ignavibacteriaceae bacterium]|nr:hypothetical protein [Ignavibacteriaceae bacterium]